MKHNLATPVLIPACNEALRIERTLDSLACQSIEVDPHVIVNGSTDRTADIARATGATVLESEHGKMRAIQAGLRHLGKSALEPFMILDGDTRPFSKGWSSCMTSEMRQLPNHQPAVVWGPVAFEDDINPLVGTGITLYTSAVSWADRHDDDPRTIRGCNMGLSLRSDEVFEELLELDNFWPRQDVAIYDTVMQPNGISKVIFKPQAWVNTSGHRYQILKMARKQLQDRRHPNRLADEAYDARTPEGGRPYNSPYTRHSNKNPALAKK
jgi:glycosyltransferase involved in cell wall biosynthesis